MHLLHTMPPISEAKKHLFLKYVENNLYLLQKIFLVNI